MARSRLEFHEVLQNVVQLTPGGFVPDETLFPGGILTVYFQPPTKMRFPCVRYERDSSWVSYADNLKYLFKKRYQVTVIDRDPDSAIPDLVELLDFSKFDRSYATDGLNHWVYNLYF